MVSIFRKIGEMIRMRAEKQSISLYDFVTKTSDADKKKFLKKVVEAANEDQRKIVERARRKK